MSHDIDDLLEIIKRLEERIIQLEHFSMLKACSQLSSDNWYWDH